MAPRVVLGQIKRNHPNLARPRLTCVQGGDDPVQIFLLQLDRLFFHDKVSKEHGKHKDIIQGDFTDAYFNNTIKTLMSLQWAYKYCDNSRYYLFVDDDYYVSNKNLLLFLKNPSKYEDYIKMSNLSEQNDYKNDLSFYGG